MNEPQTDGERPLVVAMVSTVTDTCGIGDYTGDLVRALENHGVVVHRFSVDRDDRTKPGFYRQLRARLLRAAPDVVHLQHADSFFGDGPLPAAIARGAVVDRVLGEYLVGSSALFDVVHELPSPVVVTLHELPIVLPDRNQTGLRRAFAAAMVVYAQRLAYLQGSSVIAHSSAKEQDLKRIGVPASKIAVIPLGVAPLRDALPARDDARRALGVSANCTLFTFGFITPRKRIDELMTILAQLPDDTILVVGGDTPEYYADHLEQLKAEVRTRKLEHRVRFVGNLAPAEISQWLAACDVFVLGAQVMGGGSMSLNTAVAAGVPVVAWDIPAVREIDAQLKCITRIKTGDLAAYACAIEAFKNDPELVAAAARATREAAQRHSTSNEAAVTVKLYRRVVHTASTQRASWRWREALAVFATTDRSGPMNVGQVLRYGASALKRRLLNHK